VPFWRQRPTGLPTRPAVRGISLVTSEPDPISAFSPIVTPGFMVHPAPMDANLLIRVFNRDQSPLLLGYLSLVKVTWGPMKTPSSIVTPVGMKTNGLILHLSPIVTPSSM